MKILSHPIKHSDLNAMLPGYFGDMIKAVVGNRSRDVQDPAVRKQIIDVVNSLIQ